MLILVLESSTTSAKAMLYHPQEGVVQMLTKEYTSQNSDVESQDAEGVFMQTVQLGRQICEGRRIDGIALGGVWHSVLLCDREMKPQTRVFSWANTMASNICDQIRTKKEEVDRFYQKTGCMVNAIYPAFKLMYLKQNGYRLEDYYIMGQGSYNTYRLAGQRIVTDSMASGSGLLNIHTKEFDPEILAEIGITKDQLCSIVTYKEKVLLSKEGAELLGLEAGIPVIPACPDGGLNQVGVGALNEGIMSFSVGTSAAIRLSTAGPIIPVKPSTWCYLSPVMWLSGAATSGACNCIDWMKDNFLDMSYQELEQDGEQVLDTPVFLPFLYGERCPGWQDKRRGAFLGLQPHHTKLELYRAVQEGILFNIYQSYRVLCELNGVPKKIILSGGILNSRHWTQMCADIFGAELEIPTVEQSSLMGAAVLAMERLGVIADARDYTCDIGEKIIPNPEKKEIYTQKYEAYSYWYDKMH
jgi:gluconokinase